MTTAPSTSRLAVSGLTLAYGPKRVLRGVDLHIGAGELVGLIGPNGSGKMSLGNIVLSYLGCRLLI